METRTQLALQVAQLRTEVMNLRSQLSTDVTTGVRSKRYLSERIAQEEREARPCAVILIDIDHFKRVNDTHGHARGDLVLHGVAQALAGAVRSSDDVGRWGGEEFLVLCPNTDVDEAAALAERLRVRVEGLEWPFSGSITISAGADARDETPGSLAMMIERADAAMYAAKRGGRNRVVAAGTTVLGT